MYCKDILKLLNPSLYVNKTQTIKQACWNIRRGLVKRELEIKNLLQTHELKLLFLVETDTDMIKEEKEYQFPAMHSLRGKA